MVCDIGSTEAQLALSIPTFGICLRYFGVFHDSVFTATHSYHTDGLDRISLTNNLGRTFGILGDTVPDESWVSYTNETVVNAVSMEVLDLVSGEVVQNGDTRGQLLLGECSVDASVSVRCF